MSGVPNPYSLHVHPYPTRFHGPIYTRPVFGMPWKWAPQSVFKPNDMYNGGGGMNGLGAYEKESLQYETGEGVFRPGGHGGGIFDNSIAGIFGGVKKAIGALGASLGAEPLPVPSKCWDAPGFKDCHNKAFAEAQTFCQANLASLSMMGYTSLDNCVDQYSRQLDWDVCIPKLCVPATASATSAYPWNAYSDATKTLQTDTNIALKNAGYCTLTVDGKLGPATCGARKLLGLSVPSTCVTYKTPTKPPCYTSSVAYSAPSSSTITADQQAAMTAAMSSGGSDWKRYAAFGVGALAVVGAAYYFNKKKKGRA